MTSKPYIDSSVLMDHPKEVFEQLGNVFLSSYVTSELDHLRKNGNTEETKFQARRAMRYIDENEDKVTYIVSETNYNLPLNYDRNNMDNKIICVLLNMYKNDKSFIAYSNDIGFRQKCKDLGIPYARFDGNKGSPNKIYKGYKELSGDTNFVNNLFSDVENGINEYQFVTNEYLILYNTDTKKISEYRYSGEKFVNLKLPDSKVIKGKNSLQRCALDLLNNKDITTVAINGTVGSGKTYLCVRMGVYHVNDKGNFGKLLVIREALGEGKEVGYLKGTFEEKTKMFFKPVVHSLEHGENDLESFVSQGIFETNIPYYLKGTTYNDTVIVCDESEDFSKKQLKLAGTRIGENSKIYFAGDYKQSTVDSSERNALVQMCNELKGKKEFGCIYLEEDVRSQTSKMFSELFEDK